MSEISDNNNQSAQIISLKRILILTVLAVTVGSLLSLIFVNRHFAIGFFIGGILSLVNYYWLKTSLKKVFEKVVPAQDGEEVEKPRFVTARFIFRYLFLGFVLYLIWMTKLVPIAAVLVGLLSFAAAVMVESVIIIFNNVIFKKEI